MSEILFFSENIDFKLKNKTILNKWLVNSISNEGKKPENINIIFCNDDYLLEINKKYLNKNTLTDVITFDYSEQEEVISGEIYISYQRIVDNATKYKQTVDNELYRVIIHGILHLIGYNDNTENKKEIMTQKEDYYLSLLSKIRFT
jgi:rRNA maturation RNase YbeY